MQDLVLLIDGGGTQTLPIARSIKKEGHKVHLFYENRLTYGFGTRYADRKVRAPSVRSEAEYLVFLKEYIQTNKVDVVIPMSDPTAEFLSKHKYTLRETCNFIIPDYDIFMKGYDKNELMKVCRDGGFPHPRTSDLTVTAIKDIDESMFPAILKPNLTTGGRGMKILKSKKGLAQIIEQNTANYGPGHLQELIPAGGRQIKVELFLNGEGQLINSSVIDKERYYPVAGGSSCFNITISEDKIVEICKGVLQSIGWIGFADFDLIEDPRDGMVKIMEINPRIPACIKSAIESGVDYGNLIVDASMGRKLQSYYYTPGKQLRHIGFDFLWMLRSPERFRARTSWFNFFNRNQSFQDFSFRDPIPFILGTIGNIRKMTKSEFRKSKNKATA